MMKKCRPQNPIYLILSLLMPWRFMNTYYILKKDMLIISRYYARKNAKEFEKKIDKLDLDKLVKFGLPKDIVSTKIEPIIRGSKGTYRSQEIQFLFKDGTIIAWNIRPYTKKQLRLLAELLYLKTNVKASGALQKIVEKNRERI